MALRGVVLRVLIFVLTIMASSCFGYEEKGCQDNERKALLELHSVFNCSSGLRMPSWGQSTTKEGKDCCQWFGITYNFNTGRVVKINLLAEHPRNVQGTCCPNLTILAVFERLEVLNLRSNDIDGGIPKAICDLKLLKTLYLGDNKLVGSIPSCLCTLRFLTELDLSDNKLNGSIPSCLSTMRSLRELDLSSNYLYGNFPSDLGGFQSLTSLDLVGNQIQVNYSSWLCNLHSLTALYLSNANNIPLCLGYLNKLIDLYLEGDGLKWSIPSSIFSNLTDLFSLTINYEGLEGTLQFAGLANLSKLEILTISSKGGLEINTENPISWFPHFQLRYLDISNCAVNKGIGKRFPTFLWTQVNLVKLELVNTSITGTPPIGLFCNSTLSSLDLHKNQFFGPFPLPCHNVSQGIFIDLSFNDINGSLPENINLSFPNLWYFNMAGNNLQGHIPMSLGHAPLSSLDLSDNTLSGKFPPTFMRNQTKLQYLNVSFNHLQGEMFPIAVDMPILTILVINNNNFTGSLLQRLSNSSGLKIIDAGYNSFIDDLSCNLPYFTNMKILSLRDNSIQGELPKQLCQMQYLHFLDLSRNNLWGNFLPCFHNISLWASIKSNEPIIRITLPSDARLSFMYKYSIHPYEGVPLQQMSILDLSMNMINGVIPQEIGELKALRSLNLSNNHIQGFLPMTMANMYGIESLDLSHNQLIGSIPHEMVRLSSLSVFTIAFNNLSGMIPYEGQFGTFLKNSYEGNPRLCGKPLENVCHFGKEREDKMVETREKKDKPRDSDDALFYSLIIVSYILGFWGFLGYIFINTSWSMKYLKIIDEYWNMYLQGL